MIYRKAYPEEYPKYLAFANKVFTDAHGEHHFDTLLPKIYAPGMDTADMQYIAVDNAGDVRALVACLPGKLHIGDAVLKTGFIGTVSVHAENRGEGHMKKLMQLQVESQRVSGCDLLILDGMRQRYGFFGFVPGGEAYRFDIEEGNVRHALKQEKTEEYTFTQIHPGSVEEKEAQAIQQVQPLWYDRSYAGFAVTCLSFRSVPWLVRMNGNTKGVLIASQSKNDIRELLVPDESYRAVLKAWFNENRLEEVQLCLPAWEKGKIENLASWVQFMQYGWHEMIHILNFRRVTEAFLRLKSTYAVLADDQQSYCADGQIWTV